MFTTNVRRGVIIGLAVLVLVAVAWAVLAGRDDGRAAVLPVPQPAEEPGAVTGPAAAGGDRRGATGAGQDEPAGAGQDDAATPPLPQFGAESPGAGGAVKPDPDAPLTWEGLYAMLQSGLDATAAPRIQTDGLAGLLEPGAQRTDPVSRGQLSMAVVRALGLEEVAEAQRPVESLFQDISPLHRAFAAVAMTHRLGLIPHRPGDLFRPEDTVTVAEATEIIAAARELDIRTGRVAEINAPANSLTLAGEDGVTVSYVIGPDTAIVRNGVPATAQDLLPEDTVRAVADASGLLRLLVAEGQELSRSQQALTVLASVLRELLTPEQTAAILDRDWQRAENEFKVNLYNQLLEHGMTPEEAAAVLDQDWQALTEHGKARLTELVASRWPVAPELVRAVLDEDWDTALSYAEVEVLEYLLNELMEATSA
ncbi:MAG TPA: hypothetical protein VIK93_01165 [Limnochordales bacterium]